MKRSVCLAAFLFVLGGIGLAQEIRVTNPTSSSSWNIRETWPIKWTSTGVTQPSVKIMLWQGATFIMNIADNAPNNGYYTWDIPGSLALGTYKVRVKTIGADVVGISDAFNISNAKITVTEPGHDVTWKPGETHLIQWTHTGPMADYVRIVLEPHLGGPLYYAADSTDNDGSFSWTIPPNVIPAEYKLVIRAVDGFPFGVSPRIIIGSGARVLNPRMERPPNLLIFPVLSISDVKLTANDDGFVITFGYKNSGTGPLPKGPEMPVKPDFRVLIDNREVARGNLIFPAFEAPPGWEMPTFYGCEIKYQSSGIFDYKWTIGNLITVKINENKANGMASDSKSYNLKPMALNFSYDVMITGATLDWNTGILRADIRIDGDFASYDQIRVFDAGTNVLTGTPAWEVKAFVVPGRRFYTLSKKRDGLKNQIEHKVSLGVILIKGFDARAPIKDIEHRNNIFERTFHR
jgi:hypothetical protein